MRTPALLAALVVLGCTSRAESPPPSRAPEAPEVGVVELRREAIEEPILGTGIIAAVKTTAIGPNVDGIVEEVFVDVGDRVEAGDPLFRTRDTEWRIRLQERAAAVRLAEAEVAKAELDLTRLRELHDQHVVSSDRLDAASTAFRIASARLESAEAAFADAKQNLADTRVTAPYGGVVTGRFVDEGAYVRAMVSSSAPVVEIMKTDLVLAIVHVPEVHLPRIERGTPATVRVDGLDREIETTVEIVNDRVEPTSHTVELRLPILNPDLAIKPGLFAKAYLRPPSRSALVVPRPAVLGPSGSRYVFVERDGRAWRHSVEVRDLDAGRFEVRSGIESGSRVLVGARLNEVVDGDPVRITEAPHATL